MNILLSTAYFAPIQYYSKLISYDEIIIEQFENFPKQTYRNRCNIYGANGLLTLSVPVTKGDNLKVLTKDIRIDDSSNWQKIHLKAIESAYSSSPFYEFYIDDLMPIFEQKQTFLIDLNSEIQQTIFSLIGVDNLKIVFSEDYYTSIPIDLLDFRNEIHPKSLSQDADFVQVKYRQVFEPKLGFLPNLSILDLLFNTGPDCLLYLKKSVNQVKI